MAQDTSSKTESRRYTRSSSFIMALVFTILCGLASLSLGYFINFFAKGHFVESTEMAIDAEIRYVDLALPKNTLTNGQLYIFLQDDGTLPPGIPRELSLLAEGILVFNHESNGKLYAAKIHTLADGRRMLVGKDITSISEDFQFMQWLGIASIVFVMLVVFVAYVISVFVVSGTNNIARTAQEIIDTGDLSRRVDVGGRWDDLSNMAAVLNILLDRVEELMHGVRQVSDNIAHDLRTPLTRLRGHIESLQKQYGHDDYAELMVETDQLLGTFNALLRISRIEAEKQRSQFSEVDLKKLLEDVVSFYEPLAEDKSITLDSDLSDAEIHGDRDLLFQAYANLLDNAVKFTPENGQVSLSLSQENGRTHIVVSDNGPGIAQGDEEKIFNRFYRGEKSRSSAGTGLGLSLVSAVIGLHGGNVQAENNDPGLRIITIL